MIGEQVKKVELEQKELREWLSATARELAILDGLLVHYWDAKGEIEHKVLRTHRRGKRWEVVFNPAGVAARVPLFAKLDDLTKEWGPVKTDRNAVKDRLAGYERDYKRLENELKYLKRKETKGEQGQGQLF